MIDIEWKVINAVADAVGSIATVFSDTALIPSTLPAVQINEVENATVSQHQTENRADNYATLTYEINVYSKQSATRKEHARSIALLVDEAMQNLNFTRIMMSPTPNIDRTVYRITMRYTAIAQEPISNGTDTVTYIYRR